MCAQKGSAPRLRSDSASAWADTAHKIRNCLCTLSGSMQLVQKQKSCRDKKTEQLLTLISDEVTRLDGLVRELLVEGEMGCLHHDQHEMSAILAEATAAAVRCLGVQDSIKVEVRQPISEDVVLADHGMFVWAWAALLSSVFRWTGPRGEVSYCVSSYEHKNTKREKPRKILEVRLVGTRKQGEVVWDLLPDLEGSFHGDSGEPSLKLARVVIERHGGELELGLESRESVVLRVTLPVAVGNLCKEGRADTIERRGCADGG